MKKPVLFILFTFSIITLKANFDFNQNCINAYNNVIELNFNEAKKYISIEKNVNANNKIIHYLENYIDFLTLFIGENKELYEQIKDKKQQRIDLIEPDKENSPYYLFTQAEMNLHWAFV